VLGEDPVELVQKADAKTLQNRAGILRSRLATPTRTNARIFSPRPDDPATRNKMIDLALKGRHVPEKDWPALKGVLGQKPVDELSKLIDRYFEQKKGPAK
jgi:hypothetical protein